MKKLSEYERGFIEAFIDTDGTIGAYMGHHTYKNSKSPNLAIRVDFINTEHSVLEKVKTILEHGTIQIRTQNKGSFRTIKPIYRLVYYSGTAEWLLPQLKLVIKEEKRQTIIKIIKSHTKTTDWNTKYNNIIKLMHQMEWATKFTGKLTEDFPTYTKRRPNTNRDTLGRYAKEIPT